MAARSLAMSPSNWFIWTKPMETVLWEAIREFGPLGGLAAFLFWRDTERQKREETKAVEKDAFIQGTLIQLTRDSLIAITDSTQAVKALMGYLERQHEREYRDDHDGSTGTTGHKE